MENVENNIDELCPTVEGEIDAPEVIFTSEAESYLTGDIITPQMFGAKADGVTDDSEAIKAAIAALPRKGGTLYFPPGVYIHGDGKLDTDTEKGTGNSYDYVGGNFPYRPNVYQVNEGGQTQYKAVVNKEIKDIADVGRDIRFYFGPNEKGENYENLTILGYGAEIRSNDNNGQNRNNAMFMFVNCHGVKIKGLKLDGRREERGIDQDDHIPGPINEFLQCNITFSYGSRDILIEDVTCINSVHDGISIGWEVDNVKILNCVCDNAQRNGIAICGCKNVIIEGCQCNDSGTSGNGYRGIAPKCGIDIEGHVKKSPNVNVHVSNCTIENNVTQGLVVHRWANTVTVDRCYFKNNQTVCTDNGEIENAYLTNSTLINSPLHTGFTLTENNYVENHYVKGNPYLSNGFSYDDIGNRDDTEHTCRNNIFKFVVDKKNEGKENESDIVELGAYMGIRLQKKMKFIGNKVIGAFSASRGVAPDAFYPVMLLNDYCKDNVFTRVYTEFKTETETIHLIDYAPPKVSEWDSEVKDESGKVVLIAVPEVRKRIYYREGYAEGDYRDNNDFGEYNTYGSKDMHREVVTDTTIKKSYSFNGNLTNKVYRVPSIGITKIRATYFGQEEEIILPGFNRTRIQHICRLETKAPEFTANSILTVYDIYPYIYLKINVPYPMFTASREMDYYYSLGNYKDFFTEELMTDVTAEVNAGTISIPNSSAINMIRQYGDNWSRPTYGRMEIGTMYYDTTLKKPLWWDGEKWLDKDGNDLGDFTAFTVDGVTCITKRNATFAEWVKSRYNDLRLRLADGADPVVVSADGKKRLLINYQGPTDTQSKPVMLRGNDSIHDINLEKNPGIYWLEEAENLNPDYSKVPVFWNGTELVSATIYNGEVEDV